MFSKGAVLFFIKKHLIVNTIGAVGYYEVSITKVFSGFGMIKSKLASTHLAKIAGI